MVGAICVGQAYAASMVSSTLLAPMMMDLITKDWPGSRGAIELGKRTIWFAMDLARTTPTWRAVVDVIRPAVYRGVCPR
jgi:hypothetical protein